MDEQHCPAERDGTPVRRTESRKSLVLRCARPLRRAALLYRPARGGEAGTADGWGLSGTAAAAGDGVFVPLSAGFGV